MSADILLHILQLVRQGFHVLAYLLGGDFGVNLGEMILELPKGSTNVAAMEQYLKERGLELEELSNNVNGGEEHVDGTN